MRVDWYSKVVLTLIAVALAVIAVGQLIPGPVVAQGASCGLSRGNPCYVEAADFGGLNVDIGVPTYNVPAQGSRATGLGVINLN
jgi:hypothetical protein